jgi:hypothetical protein
VSLSHLPLRHPRPNAAEFVNIIAGQTRTARVPLVEYLIDEPVLRAVVTGLLGREWAPFLPSHAAQAGDCGNFIEFWFRPGYDCVRFETGLDFGAGVDGSVRPAGAVCRRLGQLDPELRPGRELSGDGGRGGGVQPVRTATYISGNRRRGQLSRQVKQPGHADLEQTNKAQPYGPDASEFFHEDDAQRRDKQPHAAVYEHQCAKTFDQQWQGGVPRLNEHLGAQYDQHDTQKPHGAIPGKHVHDAAKRPRRHYSHYAQQKQNQRKRQHQRNVNQSEQPSRVRDHYAFLQRIFR